MSNKIKPNNRELAANYLKAAEDLERSMLDMFKEKIGVDDNEYQSVVFISMLIYHCEKALERSCLFIFRKGIIIPFTSEMVGFIFGELTFTSKINVYEKLLSADTHGYSDLIRGVSYFRELNNIRNKIFHCKLNDILYKSEPITNIQTRIRMIEDLIAAGGGNISKN